jgi:ribosomal protein S18 acetylase RimI-like enzyme
MAVELRPSRDFSVAELASVFTAAYEGYFVPFAVDEAALQYMIDVFDLDLERSVVAVDDRRPVALGNVGLRSERAWLGGVGVVPDYRGQGVGERVTRCVLERARTAGAREIALEVIVENAPAIALYEKLAFVRTRELEVLSASPGADSTEPEEVELEEALRLIVALRESPEPWQRDGATIANLTRRTPGPKGIKTSGAAAVYREDDGRISLLQAAGQMPGLRELIVTLRARGRITALNFPAAEPTAELLREVGADVVVRQYEMVARLG